MTHAPLDATLWMLLIVSAIATLLVWGIKTIASGSIVMANNRVVKRLGLVTLAALASLFVSSNTVEALLHPLGAGTWIALLILAALATPCIHKATRSILRWSIMGAVSLAGLLVIYQFAGLWNVLSPGMGLFTVFLFVLPMLIGEAFRKKHSGADTHTILPIVMSLACAGGLAITAYQLIPMWKETTLPYWVNWQILLESYKNWKHLLLGVGAENFLAAFTAGRPTSLNMTPLWNTRFTLGSSMLFHIATVYGIIGAAAFGWFLAGLHPAILFPAALSLIFLPPNFGSLVVIVTILIVSEPPSHMSFARPPLAKLTAIGSLLIVGTAAYGLVRAYGAELAFASSLKALERRDGTAAYNAQITAITRNPQVTRFHTAYSQTNLALANALAGSATSSAEPDQLDKDRQTTTQLIQQAIREAKIAVNLAPTNILAWENIASVYQTLTGVAQGADQWTVAAYQQAMQLDPNNPVVRLRLGGAYVGQQKFDQAAESYAAAISLKPDYANAYYNLAFVYREQKKYLPAAQAIKESLTYVTNPDDLTRAQKELEELGELLTEEEKQLLSPLP